MLKNQNLKVLYTTKRWKKEALKQLLKVHMLFKKKINYYFIKFNNFNKKIFYLNFVIFFFT